ncbi:hypothetical protein PFISCL1PPCAC_21881, partial [Pristionchus fissidentatus]
IPFQFPILELPAELSAKILSYMEERELPICLQSFPLDKVHAECNKNKRIENLTISAPRYESEFEERRFGTNVFGCSFSQLCDRMQTVFNKCEIGILHIRLKLSYFSVSSYLPDVLCLK